MSGQVQPAIRITSLEDLLLVYLVSLRRKMTTTNGLFKKKDYKDVNSLIPYVYLSNHIYIIFFIFPFCLSQLSICVGEIQEQTMAFRG